MKTQHTLRYLLLRHMKPFEARVSPSLFREATRSLGVEVERDSYIVTWDAAGERHRKILPLKDFVFYQRGDTRLETRSPEDDLRNENNAHARKFAEGVFGTAAPVPKRGEGEALEPYGGFGVLEAVAFSLGAGMLGGLGPATALGLAALFLVEYLNRGRTYASVVFVLLALVGPPAAALCGAAAYGLLQLLDPDSTQRRLRAGVCAGAAGLAAISLVSVGAGLELGVGTLGVAALSVGLATVRSLYATHFRALPLALPLYCGGLYVDQQAAAALIGLAVLALSTFVVAYGHRWVPVQQERGLTPNG